MQKLMEENSKLTDLLSQRVPYRAVALRAFILAFGFIVVYVHRLRSQLDECVQDLLPDIVRAVNLPPALLQLEQAVVGGVVVRAQPMGDLVLSQDRTQELSLDGVFEDGDLDERRFLFQWHAKESREMDEF
jgi:hypothetical protein